MEHIKKKMLKNKNEEKKFKKIKMSLKKKIYLIFLLPLVLSIFLVVGEGLGILAYYVPKW
jgi:hypothetical protein